MRAAITIRDRARDALRRVRLSDFDDPAEAAAEQFAAVQRPLTRVDTGELLASVDVRRAGFGYVAGYGVRYPQALGKMLAEWNRERFEDAVDIARPLMIGAVNRQLNRELDLIESSAALLVTRIG